MINSKAKGSAFEREVCKALSRWVTNGEREDVFWRSAMSGGRATVARGKVRQCGDITAVAEEGYEFASRWYVECKHVKKLGLDQFLIKSTGPLAKFWKIAVREAKKHERNPLMIAKQNGWPVLVISHRDHLASWTPPLLMCIQTKRGGLRVDVTLFSDLLVTIHAT